MFDFAWSEIALIGVVALVAIGPKDLPVAIKAVAEMVKKARRMASEFQIHVDEMVREANLHEMKDTFNDLRRMDIKGKILDAVDGDHGLRDTIRDNPFDINKMAPPLPDTAAALTETTVPPLTDHAFALSSEGALPPGAQQADMPPPAAETRVPAYAPPAFIPPAIAAAGPPAQKPPPPSFVPPQAVALAAAHHA